MDTNSEEVDRLKVDLQSVFTSFTRLTPEKRVERAQILIERAEELEDELRERGEIEEAQEFGKLIAKTVEKLDDYLEHHPNLMNGEVA